MFIDINNYMLLSKHERQMHINLNEPCNEIGGASSIYFKGLLAYFLNTTIPTRIPNIHLCHACGNSKCSNPKHLYWGTYKENAYDKKIHGTFKTIREYTINKHGLKKANRMQKHAASLGGKKGRKNNKLSNEQIENKLNLIKDINLSKFGLVNKVSKKLNISHTQVRRFINAHYKGKTFKRK